MRSAREFLKVFTLGFAAFVASCSDDAGSTSSTSSSSGSTNNPNAVTKKVGPDGDTIVVDGATVTIPKGALTETKDITITATSDPAPAGYVALSKVFKCEPSGTDFAQPVIMKMPFTDDGKGPSTMFWSSGADPTFKDVGGTAVEGTMSATVKHFSAGFVGRKQ